MPRPKRCGATGKVRHPNETVARAELRRLRTTRVATWITDVYLCPHCDEWHLTSTRRRAGRQA